MPASYVEILSEEWVSRTDTLRTITTICEKGELYVSFFKYDVIIKVNPNSDERLNLELQDENNLRQYYNLYPTAITEPKEYNPFFYLEKETGKIYKSIASANHYFDDFVNWEFSRLYLKRNPKHIIAFNRDAFILYSDIVKIENSVGFTENWMYKK